MTIHTTVIVYLCGNKYHMHIMQVFQWSEHKHGSAQYYCFTGRLCSKPMFMNAYIFLKNPSALMSTNNRAPPNLEAAQRIYARCWLALSCAQWTNCTALWLLLLLKDQLRLLESAPSYRLVENNCSRWTFVMIKRPFAVDVCTDSKSAINSTCLLLKSLQASFIVS